MLGVHARRPMHDYLLPPIVFSSKKKSYEDTKRDGQRRNSRQWIQLGVLDLKNIYCLTCDQTACGLTINSKLFTFCFFPFRRGVAAL